MLIIKITACAILTALLSVMLRSHRPELSLVLGLAGGILMLLMASKPIADVVSALLGSIRSLGEGRAMLTLALKILGIAVLSETGADLCRDAGLSGAAMKAELAGKVIIVALMLPTVGDLLDILGGLMA